jgi:hypothetical protein
MSGAIPPLPLYAFMACIGTPILFVIFQYRKFHAVMHEKYTLYVTSHFTKCMYIYIYIFVLINAPSGTFATADALSSSHNEASGRM